MKNLFELYYSIISEKRNYDILSTASGILRELVISDADESELLSKHISCFTKELYKKLTCFKSIVLCGASPFAKNTARILESRGGNVVILDDSAGYFDNIRIEQWDKISKYEESLFILCSRPFMDKHLEIVSSQNIICYQTLLIENNDFDSFPSAYTNEKVILQIKDIIKNAGRYFELLNNLGDDRSKEILARIILFRLTFDASLHIGAKTSYPHYFDSDIYQLGDEEVFVDGGGYTGDTLSVFLNLVDNKFKGYYLFEPEEQLILKAQKVTNDNRVTFHRMGLHESKSTLHFKNGEGTGNGTIVENGEISIDVIDIDSCIKEPVTIIKMDVEGSELEALKGARNTIKKYQPKLIICVYHKYNDILNISDYISSICDYKFYLRAQYNNVDTETYLICLPAGK